MKYSQLIRCPDCEATGELTLDGSETINQMLVRVTAWHKQTSPECGSYPFRFRALYNPGKGETAKSQAGALASGAGRRKDER